jgi:hypothetical protein
MNEADFGTRKEARYLAETLHWPEGALGEAKPRIWIECSQWLRDTTILEQLYYNFTVRILSDQSIQDFRGKLFQKERSCF